MARTEPWPEEWLLVDWPDGEAEPSKYWFSTLPPRTTLKRLVRTAKVRWRIERDYQGLKQEIGLSHYEGRGWRGVHHHASLCIAAYGFLVAERCLFPSSLLHPGLDRATCATPRLPAARRCRGLSATSLIRSHPSDAALLLPCCRPRQHLAAVPMLPTPPAAKSKR